MATSSFYNDNLYRTYPFVAEDHSVIPDDWLVGLKVCFNHGAGFKSFPSVFLTRWRTENGESTLEFSCEAADKVVSKSVVIPSDTPPMTRIVSDDTEMIQIVLIVGHCPLGGIEKTGLRVKAEPTCTLWYQHRGITSVQVGNRPRRYVPLPDGVESEHYGKAEWWKQGQDDAVIVGPLLFNQGFNCRIHPRAGNRLQLDAVRGAGRGVVSDEISRGCADISGTMVCEEPPAEFLRMDGLPDVGSVLYSFCGAVGPHVRMTSTSTIRLTAEPEQHTILIGVGNLGGGAC